MGPDLACTRVQIYMNHSPHTVHHVTHARAEENLSFVQYEDLPSYQMVDTETMCLLFLQYARHLPFRMPNNKQRKFRLKSTCRSKV